MILAPWQRYALAGVSWSPDALFVGGTVAGFWADLDAANAITRNTQPDNTNSNFATWTGVAPDATPTGWTKIPTPGVSANHIEDATNACRLVSDGALVYVAKFAAIIGNRYRQYTRVISIVSGVIRTFKEDLLVLGDNTHDYTTVSTTQGVKRSSACDATFSDVTFQNLSVVSVACKGTLGNIAQATAAAMPYEQALGSRKGVYCAIEDGAVLGSTKSTQRHFHDGTGVTFRLTYLPDALAATRTLIASADAATSAGFSLTVATNGAITYSVYNTAAGTPYLTCTSSAGVIVAGSKARILCTMSTAGCEVYVNGVLVASDYVVAGSPSTGDASYLVKVGNLAAAYTAGAVGVISDVYSVAKVVSASERAALTSYFALRQP